MLARTYSSVPIRRCVTSCKTVRTASTARELLLTLALPFLLLLAKTPALEPLSILPPRLSHGLVTLGKFELSLPQERFQSKAGDAKSPK